MHRIHANTCHFRVRAGLIVTAGALLTAACQEDTGAPPVLSLKEARQATVSLQGQTFTPPPRTITNITAILDSQKQEDSDQNRKMIERADGKLPDGLRRGDRIRFFTKRGRAAIRIGRTAQAIEDLSRANRIAAGARRMKPVARARLLSQLADAKFLGGRPRDAIDDLRRAIDMNQSPIRGAFWASRLSIWMAFSGDLTAAGNMIRRAEGEIGSAQSATGRRATTMWEKNGLAAQAAVNRAAARLDLMKGDFPAAEKRLRQALAGIRNYRRSIEGTNSKQRRRLVEYIQADLGMAILRQKRYLEAEVEIRAALDAALKRTGRYSPEVARFAANLASVMDGQGRPADAEKLARASLEILQSIGSENGARFMSLARTMLGKSLAAQERWKEAEAELSPLFAADADEDTFVVGQSGAVFALVLLQQGKAERAEKIAGEMVALLKPRLGRKHRTTAEAVAVLAMAQARTGKTRDALRNFRDAMPILLSRSRGSDDETDSVAGGARLMALIFDAYIRLLADVRGTQETRDAGIDATEVSFSIADAARAGRVQKALAASAARAAVRDGDLADLVRREQDVIKRIGALNSLYAAAVSVPESQRNPEAVVALRTRIDTLRGARAALTEEIERRFPEYARLMAPKPARIADVRSSLRDGEAMIVTYVGTEDSFVWAITRLGSPRFARVSLGRDRLAAAIRDLRVGVVPTTGTLDGIPAFDVRLAHKLYQALLAPVRESWKDANDLLIVAHDSLGQLPFSMLVTERPASVTADDGTPLFSGYRTVSWLARTHAVTVLPSVGSLATLRATPPPAAGRRSFVGFGDPVFDPSRRISDNSTAPALALRGGPAKRAGNMQISMRAAPKDPGTTGATLSDLPRLRDTAAEIRGMALALSADPARDIFIGRAASEGQVRSMKLSDYRILAFATHGLVPGDLNGLTQPALALSAPQSGGPGAVIKEDGLLTMGEILGLRLDADWVVLSACNTASGQGAGAEAVSGLGRAFFYAGTRALLVSNWPVETTSARALTTDLFRRQASGAVLGRAEALRRAMVGMIDGGTMKDDKGRVVFSYAHPLFWAPFSLVGDGGGRPGS